MEKPPRKSTAREVTEQAIVAATSAVPVAGSPLAVAFSMAMGWTYNRRMQDWLDDLAEAVSELQGEQGESLDFEDLAGDPVFVDAVVNATRCAQATHQEEKLDALRNAVVNSIGQDSPGIDEQARFFRLVEQFTPAHLRLLSLLHDPGAVLDSGGIERPNFAMGGRSSIIELLPEFSGNAAWYQLLANDLASAGLTNHGGLNTTISGPSLWLSTTTELGNRFLRFIAPPDQSKGQSQQDDSS